MFFQFPIRYLVRPWWLLPVVPSALVAVAFSVVDSSRVHNRGSGGWVSVSGRAKDPTVLNIKSLERDLMKNHMEFVS
ncbi:Hippocampus Abundant Transcript-Like Protein 1 [Manis pentadactyla]|nr:Hippocampus Abundant Transcript-Like Protein 1 [Manis pentadactyla]